MNILSFHPCLPHIVNLPVLQQCEGIRSCWYVTSHVPQVKNTDYVSRRCKQSSVTAWFLLTKLNPNHSVSANWQDLSVLFAIIIGMILTKEMFRFHQVLMTCLICTYRNQLLYSMSKKIINLHNCPVFDYYVEITILFCHIGVWVRLDGNGKQTGLYSGNICQF